MRSLLLSVCVISLVSVAFSACSDDTASPATGGDSGAAGEVGAAGAPDAAGAAGAGGAGCGTTGKGTLKVTVKGLPSGVTAEVVVHNDAGALPVVASGEYGSVTAGTYAITAARAYDADAIVRTAYEPTISEPTFCEADGDDHTVTVTYAKIPTSNQLWALNDNGDDPILSFASAKLAATSTTSASLKVAAPGGQSTAFDFDGNLWTGPATVADPIIARYPAASLTGTADPVADVAFTIPAIDCVPALKGVALDAEGNVWLSACGKQLLQIPTSAFSSSAGNVVDVTPAVTLTGVAANEDLAFDASGNLWVADDGKVVRFDKARLEHDDSDAPDLTLSVTTGDDTPKDLAANFLAFDAHGNLWALNFAGNGAFEIPKASLSGIGTHTVVSPAHVVVDVQAVLGRPAFDDGGSLWLPLAKGTFGKLTPALLAVNTDAGAPTTPAVIVSSGDVGSADSLAFFPAASGLPLAAAQP